MSEQHHSFAVEEEQPDSGRIFLFGIVVAIVFFGSALVLRSVYYETLENTVYHKVLSRPSPQLLQLRMQEEEKLTTYGWVDKDKQVVRIPVERAMRLLTEEEKK